MSSLEFSQIYLAFMACLLFTCLYCLMRQRLAWNWAILGTLPWISSNPHRIHDQLAELLQHKDGTFLLKGPRFANMDLLFTVDPANVQHVIVSKATNYPKGPQFRRIFDTMGEALLASDGDLWKFHRRIVVSHISTKKFMRYVSRTVHSKLEQGLVPLLRHVSQHGLTIDMQEVFQRFTLDVSCMLMIGHDLRALSMEFPDVPFSQALQVFEEASVYRIALPEVVWKMQRLMGLGQEKKLSQAKKIIDSFIYSSIYRRRNDLSSRTDGEDCEAFDFLTSHMKDITTQGVDIRCDKVLRDITMQVLLAGRDTTSSGLTWFLWLILKNCEVAEKIKAELIAKIPATKSEKWHVFQADETNKLVYLHAAICEALRLYPPVPFQYKSPTQQDVLPSGHHVHPKMKIIFPLYAMARMKTVWGENCSKFEPQRWILEQGKIKHEPSYKFFSFYAGPRICLGKEIALTEMKMVAATLIHNFQFQVLEHDRICPDFSLILHMKHGLNVRVHSRWT